MLNISTFINSNNANVKCTNATLEQAQHTFETKFTYDTVNDEAWPVLVYMLNNNAIAWYDEENMCGYIAVTSDTM